MSTVNFYKNIKALRKPIAEVLQHENFCDVPDDWSFIIADVQNSTGAIAAGKHNDVNLIAAGCLIAALNIAKDKNIEIPFFFTGDGGAILVPNELAEDVLIALFQHNDNCIKTMALNLHIGCMNVGEVVASGATVRIAKIQLGQSMSKAVILGNGLKVAEQRIKKATRKDATEDVRPYELNMAGLECRWDKVKPPAGENEIVCYLIEAVDQSHQVTIYREIMQKIDELYGNLESRSPLSMNRLKWLISLQKIEKEMFIKFGKWKIRYYLATMVQNFLGIFYFRFNMKMGPLRGREYLSQLIANADTLTIDGRINTIISGLLEKRIAFTHFLQGLEDEKKIVFGYHISKESVMTCYIESMDDKHIHFVDGSDGGYTEAAKELKRKLLAL